MKNWFLNLAVLFFSVSAFVAPIPHPALDYQTTFTASYHSGEPAVDEMDGLQCPIPMTDRVPNYTGIQCVYSSIEMLGRWAQEPKLTKPPLTSRSDCKSYSNPSAVNWRLNHLKVKFEQSYYQQGETRTKARDRGLMMIRKAMKEHRGVAFGIPGHMMTMVHFDETTGVMKYVDNSDRSLKIQTMTIKRFHEVWDLWVIVVYADKDVIQNKMGRANALPIIDRNRPQGTYTNDYIPMPK